MSTSAQSMSRRAERRLREKQDAFFPIPQRAMNPERHTRSATAERVGQ
jgi:hypothetical protein